MLIWLFQFAFDIVEWALSILLWMLPVYLLLRLFLPANKYVLLLNRYCESIFALVRGWLRRFFPSLSEKGLDSYFTLFAIWCLTYAARGIVLLLRRILL